MGRLVLVIVGALALAACNKSSLVAGPEETPQPTSTPNIDPPEYVGREFFAVDLDNIYEPPGPFSPGSDAAGAQYAVAVSNPSDTLTATVEVLNKDGAVQSVSVGPGALQIIQLPRADVDETTVVPNSYRITSDIPVSAHQFNPLGNVLVYSNDASLLLPVPALGNDYLVMGWQQGTPDKLPGFLTVAAVESGTTTVTVTVKANTRAGGAIPQLNAGQSHTVTLAQYDVLSIQTRGQGQDLTGSLVAADKKVAVFAGAECANVPVNVTACDHLEEQMFPLQSWGKTYVAAKSKPRGTEPDVWRVLASVNNTTVTTNPLQPGTPVTLQAGDFVEFQTKDSFVVVAGAPVLVGQYLVGQDFGFTQAGMTGDPAFILSVPVEQFRRDYIFLTPPNYANDSITIVAPTGVDVTLDGAVLSGFTPIAGSEWSVKQLTVADGVHSIEADEPIGLTVTGYDQYVSYGYPGGLNLNSLEE